MSELLKDRYLSKINSGQEIWTGNLQGLGGPAIFLVEKWIDKIIVGP